VSLWTPVTTKPSRVAQVPLTRSARLRLAPRCGAWQRRSGVMTASMSAGHDRAAAARATHRRRCQGAVPPTGMVGGTGNCTVRRRHEIE
jgi:hypothetical protein